MENDSNTTIINEEPVKKKRGRKPKIKLPEEEVIPTVPKKRGRKPKGGKIISNPEINNNSEFVKTNVILHLKCNIKDIEENNSLKNDIYTNSLEYYDNNKLSDINFISINNEPMMETRDINKNNIIIKEKQKEKYCEKEDNIIENNADSKIIWKKLKELQTELHHNNISHNKSACFWCTHEFDNPSIYIPKYKINKNYSVYGCFCSPECATAYLMNESIDTSIKFERYQLLNFLYAKIYNYTKNIKPAPDPHYLLEKFYGNLSIKEYRKLLEDNHLIMVIDKPLTRILPELHEENNDFSISNNISNENQGTYKIKKKTNKTISKNNILTEHFSKN